jgi:outer membrane receptor for ferrienterochelin and colicin
MTGQINVDLFKPESEEKLYFNAYANEGGRYEGNLTFNAPVSDNVSTAFLLHGSQRTRLIDRNEDGFLDMPLTDQLIVANRWKFYGNNGWTGQAGIKITTNESEAGQIAFYENENANDWSSKVGSDRIELWAKTGVLFNENRSSIGIQLSALTHDLDTRFGRRLYDGNQKSFYSNLIFQSLIGESGSDIKMGATFTHDNFDEQFTESEYNRSETVPGVFAEYTYMQEERWTIVGGLRYDRHNIYGGFITPRAHIRYAPTEKTVFRISAGRGQRTPSIFAENIGALASSRSFIIANDENAANKPYGLDAEVSWNFGINYQQEFEIAGRRASLGIDYFRTEFTNQIVVDYFEKFNELHFYNLQGDSYSNSLQFLMEMEPIEKVNLRAAYRLNDVKTDYLSGQSENPLIARHRAFVNLAYQTENNWSFDYTFNVLGSKKIPDTRIRPGANSPSYSMSNAQMSKLWNNTFEIYLGVENLFNYRQGNPINSAENPFSDDFDASLIWGPIFGRNVYMGVRYKIFNGE